MVQEITMFTAIFVVLFGYVCLSTGEERFSEVCTRNSGTNCGNETLRFLLLGKTGSGKSTSGNIILGEKKFKTSLKMRSETSQCQLESGQRDGTTVEVMDSVGLFDTVQSHEEVALKIFQAVASMNPGPHAVFYVVPIGQRYTEEEYNAFKRLKHYFGDDITKHMIVLLTHGNRLTEEGVTIEDYLQDTTDDFQQVLKECSNRYVVFNKYLPDMKPQVDSLFRTVRAMLKQNGGRYFQSELTQKVEDKMKEFVAEILGEAERQELAGKQTVKDLTWERETAKQEAEKYQEQSAEAQRRQEELREKLKHSEEARQNAEWEAKQRIVKGQREGWLDKFGNIIAGFAKIVKGIFDIFKLF